MERSDQQQSCNRCGDCCREGGPAFHRSDLSLLATGKIPLSHLTTIRRGELAATPLATALSPVEAEFVKLSGKQKNWSCRYYEEGTGCGIYSYRPQACRVLKCWDTAAILSLMGKDLVSRKDILGEKHPMLAVIAEHEERISCDFFTSLQAGTTALSEKKKMEIEQRVQQDLQFRDRIVREKGLSLGLELFFFGRPLFQLLRPFGIGVSSVGNRVSLRW